MSADSRPRDVLSSVCLLLFERRQQSSFGALSSDCLLVFERRQPSLRRAELRLFVVV